ncbi:MAG: hypothetical protein J0H69_00025 [Burkholderiales bacterium]|nr:hypothetical protein [Burkholderiales bacterium]
MLNAVRLVCVACPLSAGALAVSAVREGSGTLGLIAAVMGTVAIGMLRLWMTGKRKVQRHMDDLRDSVLW